MAHPAVGREAPAYSLGPLAFTFGGKELILKDIRPRDLQNELEQVMKEAGISSGNFMISAQTKGKGTAHTKGLKIGVFSVSHRSIEISWHAGSNDNRVTMQMSVPNGYNVEQLRDRLVKAQKSLATKREQEKLLRKRDVRTPTVQLAPKQTAASPAEPPASDQLKKLRELTLILEKSQGAETRKDNLRRDIAEAKVRLAAARRSVEIEEKGLAQLEEELTEVETLLESPELKQAREFASLLS